MITLTPDETKLIARSIDLAWHKMQNVLRDINEEKISMHTIADRNNIINLMNDLSHYANYLNGLVVTNETICKQVKKVNEK